MNTELVTVMEGQVVATSREVADRFGKKHRNVLRDIRNIVTDIEKIEQRKFEPLNCFIKSQYLTDNNQKATEYLITKKGFTLLAMGFEGVKALEFKVKYIEAFESMEQFILQGQTKQQYLTVTNRLAELEKIIESHTLLLQYHTLNYSQQQSIQGAIRERVKQLLGGNKSKLYKQHSKKCYSKLHLYVKESFAVGSYRDIQVTEYDNAMEAVSTWIYSIK